MSPQAPAALPASPTEIGRYRLVAPIASGGMASVHLARTSGRAGFTRLLALKLLHPHLTEDRSFVAMFLDEARFGARVRHPNVVDVYDVETIGDRLVIAMQFVEGAPLSALMREAREQGTKLPLGVVLAVMCDALRGLHAAHELADDSGTPLGLVHRDVSPQNVLVGVDGVARVTDFGVAKARGRLHSTEGGAVKGKLRYLAPEQLQGAELDRRTDVFAAGIVLWECLSGQSLFSGKHEADTMMAVLTAPIPPPSRHAPSLPLELDRMCLTALERDPDRRFPSAAAFADALEDRLGRCFAKSREIGELVERLHRPELERLRAAERLPIGAPGSAYAGEQPLALAAPSEPSDTRSAVPITAGSHVRVSGARRLRLALLGVALALGALFAGYWLGRSPTAISARPEPAVVAAAPEESTPAPAASAAQPADSAEPEPSEAPPASASAAPAVPRVRSRPATRRPASEPFMPGAL